MKKDEKGGSMTRKRKAIFRKIRKINKGLYLRVVVNFILL